MKNVLTRAGGFLRGVTSHSLQPYRGCSFGSSLCGVGCYVRANPWVTRGRPWGSFLEVRTNAAASYRANVGRERAWARRAAGEFSVFLSSSTDPFVPQERHHGVTREVLTAMLDEPPDGLVLQTHTARVLDAADLLEEVAGRTALRIHLSIETDRERLPGLPAPPSTVEARLAAAAELTRRGLVVVVTVAPLLPMVDPRGFFERVAGLAAGVVIDHFVGGDGTPDGTRTRATALPEVMEALEPGSTDLGYRDRIVALAEEVMPGRVGVHAEGFARRDW